jgi:glycosyltransferase involved in cell wall biosynthesis
MWWSSGLAWESRRRGIEIFHGTDFSIPYLPLRPSVMMVHDLSPWKRGPARARDAGRVRSRTPYLLRMATMILTPTEAIRRELSRAFGVSPARIRAVPLAAASSFGAASQVAPESDTKKTWGTKETGETGDTKGESGGGPQIPKPYLLCVGTREPRKNIARLIEAWRIVKRSRPSLGLVLAGAAGADDAPYRQEPGLHVLGRLADIEIRDLLNRTAAFVYPSLYEGFGLPVVEAMQAGAAVITSRDPALVEVSASAAMHADATCTRALARAIGQVLDSEILRNRLREQGKRRALQFSWRATARRTRATYVEAIRRF